MLADEGGTRSLLVSFVASSVVADPGFDPDAAAAERQIALLGLAETMEADAPGSTRLVLELDDGAKTELRPGDIVIQSGTRHAWRNPGERPATVAFVIGARR
jgi:hypothetical protein